MLDSYHLGDYIVCSDKNWIAPAVLNVENIQSIKIRQIHQLTQLAWKETYVTIALITKDTQSTKCISVREDTLMLRFSHDLWTTQKLNLDHKSYIEGYKEEAFKRIKAFEMFRDVWFTLDTETGKKVQGRQIKIEPPHNSWDSFPVTIETVSNGMWIIPYHKVNKL